MVVEIVDGDLNSDESYCIIEADSKKQINKGAAMTQQDWEQLSPDEKKKELYLKQVRLLDTFLEHGAISQAQYEKSFHDLTEKMGVQNVKA